MITTVEEEKWIREVLAFDPFSGDQGDPGDRELRDEIVRKCRKGGSCTTCFGRFEIGTLVRTIIMVYAVDGLATFRFCKECCDAQAKSWTDGGEAVTARYALRKRQ